MFKLFYLFVIRHCHVNVMHNFPLLKNFFIACDPFVRL